jgi:hypothetical protein
MLSNMMSRGDSLFAQSSIALLRDRRFGAIAFPPHSTRLDDPYLPLLVQGTAGLPLDPSKRFVLWLRRRRRARRFNCVLIGAGLITNL